jgi:magnesium transporter
MARENGNISRKSGHAPGSLLHIGHKKKDRTEISIINYDENHCVEKENVHVGKCSSYLKPETITWINVDGLHEIDVLEKLGAQFDIHQLVLEDILNTGHISKIETFEKYIYVVLKTFHYNENGSLVSEQISIILGKGYVITFTEKANDLFKPLQKRIKESIGRIRKMGSDYLAYAILDLIVDRYINILENLSEKVEFLEEQLITSPESNSLMMINRLKREVLLLNKSIRPLKNIIDLLRVDDSGLIADKMSIFLRDLYDHTLQVTDTIESMREILTEMLSIYLSSVSNKMNSVMKVLTIIATIFIPLTFLAGIYGMNFEWMPELGWHWAYPGLLGLMVVIGVAMVLYFKRKDWL